NVSDVEFWTTGIRTQPGCVKSRAAHMDDQVKQVPLVPTLVGITLFAFCALATYGQTANTGAIAGTVSDPSGARVPGAAVVINSQGTREKRDLATDAGGYFLVQFLTPGNYDVTVRAAGFEPFILKGVQIQITEVSRLKIQLVLSGAKEQIAVS